MIFYQLATGSDPSPRGHEKYPVAAPDGGRITVSWDLVSHERPPRVSLVGSAREDVAVGWLPGIDVTVAQPELIARLNERCSRPGYTPFEAMCLSRRVGKEVLHSAFFAAERFLVYYERHDCPRLNQLHIVPREELVAFLDERIRPERGQGVDLTITTFEMAEFLITNHDGDLWLRRPSEWPDAEEGQAEPKIAPDCGGIT